ncbi:hypothetical protein [Microbacterium sp. RU33B]|uniref:hypothetical protein n=1 Tax=Microbacterium sp. RU33B TaxID=1907390 RepID=UPI0009613E8C|nr:hypothetical protein [Microbacterium sp. RU33B]SIT66535.1 hypothetical protein SAMN05880545_0008 [Microbacterium sp. RU33B]
MPGTDGLVTWAAEEYFPTMGGTGVRRHRREALVCVALLIGVAALTVGCSGAPGGAGANIVKSIVRQAQEARVSVWSDDAVRAAAREIQLPGVADKRRVAAARLTEAGLDFACMLPVGDSAALARMQLTAEIQRRADATAQNSSLADVHAHYAAAETQMSSLIDETAVVAALSLLATYCNIDQAAF